MGGYSIDIALDPRSSSAPGARQNVWSAARGQARRTRGDVPAKQFALARVAGVMTYPALAELESVVTKQLRARMTPVCLNAAWQDVIVDARERG